MKKIISLLVAFMILIGCMPATTFAKETDNNVKRYSVLVLDVSGTAGFRGSSGSIIYTADTSIDYVKKSATTFLSSLVNAKGENYVAVVVYAKNSTVVSDFTNDIDSVTEKVENLSSSGSVRDINAGLSSADELLNNVSDDATKNVVLVTTGMTNEGKYSDTGHYNNETIGSNWFRTDTRVNLYKYANAAYDIAEKVKKQSTLYVLGLFQTMKSMPEEGKEIAEFFRLTASDLASSPNNFYDIDDPSQFEFVFGEIADDITASSGFFKYAGQINKKSDSLAEYKYSDSYFTKKATDYNPSLATMSLCLELSSWSSYDKEKWYSPLYKENDSRFWNDKLYNAKCLLLGTPDGGEGYKGIGFSNFKANNYWESAPKKDSIGVCAARKQIVDKSGKKYTVIALVVRGGGYGSEWASNFTLGESGEHEGFAKARDNVLTFLDSYVDGLNADESKNLKIWVTGYSRAGATANMVAGALDSNHNFTNGASTSINDIYCYTFEAPQGAVESEIKGDYSNIFNVRNVNDLVPFVAPGTWGFARYNYQNDRLLPSLKYTNAKKYKKQLSAMKTELNKLGFPNFDYKINEVCTVKDFKIDKSSFFPGGDPLWWFEESRVDTNTVLDEGITLLADDIIGSRKYYYNNIQYGVRQLMGIVMDYYGVKNGAINYAQEVVIQNFIDGFKDLFSFDSIKYILSPMFSLNPFYSYNSRINDVKERLCKKINSIFAEYKEIEGFIDSIVDILGDTIIDVASDAWDNNTDTINTICKLVDVLSSSEFQAHFPEVCLAWCRSLDSNYNTDIEDNDSTITRTIHINCPVDVKVYDSEGNLAGSIINDVADESIDGIINYVNNNGEKILLLPGDEAYKIEITATDDGQVNYSVGEYNYIYSDNTILQNYYNIPIKKGDNFVGIVPKIADKDFVSNDREGSECNYELYHNDVLLNADDELLGEQIDKEQYKVSLETDGNSGYVNGAGKFTKGSFAQIEAKTLPNGKFLGWYEGENLVSTDSKYRFAVTRDISITAKFTDIDFHELKIEPSKGGTVKLDDSYYPADINIELEAVPDEGYEFVEWKVNNNSTIEDAKSAKTKFTMGDSDTVLTAVFKSKDDETNKDENKDDNKDDDKTDTDNKVDTDNKDNNIEDNDSNSDEDTTADTGDINNSFLWFTILLFSGSVLFVGRNYNKKKIK